MFLPTKPRKAIRSGPQKVQVEYENQCPDCGSIDVVEDHAHGDLVCRQCGRVIGEKIIDTDREWREFESDQGGDQKYVLTLLQTLTLSLGVVLEVLKTLC
jgi:transcription elongation factor Elf1